MVVPIPLPEPRIVLLAPSPCDDLNECVSPWPLTLRGVSVIAGSLADAAFALQFKRHPLGPPVCAPGLDAALDKRAGVQNPLRPPR